MQKLITKFSIALFALPTLFMSMNVQRANADSIDDIYNKCYKFDRMLNEQELEYCRSVAGHQPVNNIGKNSITNIECGINCLNQIRLEEKQSREYGKRSEYNPDFSRFDNNW